MIETKNSQAPDRPFQPVSVAGGYWTGSSAVVDLLQEHECCVVVPEEFTLFSFGQFFKDVYLPLTEGGIDPVLLSGSMKRFDAFNRSDLYPLRSILRVVCRKLKIFPRPLFRRRAGMARTLGPEYDAACRALSGLVKKWPLPRQDASDPALSAAVVKTIDAAIEASRQRLADGTKSKAYIGVFDQIIAPPYAAYTTPAVPKMKYINVDRHWKDQYISLRDIYHTMLGVNHHTGVRPWDENLEELLNLGPVAYFTRIRDLIDQAKIAQKDRSDTIWLDFEELIFDRDNTADKIFSFLGISRDSWSPDSCFHPEKSGRNTRKWENPSRVTPEIEQEIFTLEARFGL
jgi:hypothetical protein